MLITSYNIFIMQFVKWNILNNKKKNGRRTGIEIIKEMKGLEDRVDDVLLKLRQNQTGN